MKKIFSVPLPLSPITQILIIAVASSSLFGCGQHPQQPQTNEQSADQRLSASELASPIDTPQLGKITPPQERMVRAPATATINQKSLASAAHSGVAQDALSARQQHQSNSENYQKFANAAVTAVSEQPVSTFSIDVDSASYANMRRFINNGQLPPKAAVRIEELINYFRYDYSDQYLSEAQPIAISTLLTASPWNKNNQVIRIGINSYQVDQQARPAANIVFLVDVSGSMQSKEKLPLLKKSMLLMIDQLNGDDRVAIVTYASGTKIALAATKLNHRLKIETAINQLSAGGSTHGSAGIELAYRQAQQGFIDGGINHVYLMSDGDMNVGIRDIDQLKARISQKRKAGVQFSTIGFGQGNYNDHLMEQLADTGNGVAGYIDSLHEAQKLLVDQLGSSLQTVAHDVKIQVEFNPAMVSEYRLLGYENRHLDRADFNNDKKDAGDIGAGHSVTAIYEITPTGNPGLIDPLVFQPHHQESQPDNSSDIAEVRVRYKTAFATDSIKQVQRVNPQQKISFAQIRGDDKFALAVAAFGQKLRGSEHVENISYSDIIAWANASKGNDPFGYRSEFIKLMRLTNTLAKQQTGRLTDLQD